MTRSGTIEAYRNVIECAWPAGCDKPARYGPGTLCAKHARKSERLRLVKESNEPIREERPPTDDLSPLGRFLEWCIRLAETDPEDDKAWAANVQGAIRAADNLLRSRENGCR